MAMLYKNELYDLVKIISDHPGVSISQLCTFLSGTSKRTLQYRLSKLVDEKKVRFELAGKKRKYFVENELFPNIPSSSSVIPFSIEAQEIKKKITAPISLRDHVSYRREFLASYQPNKTQYLSQPILEKLEKIGDGVKGRPAGTYARKIYERLLIDLSWNSSRLEGNTYSLLDTEKLLATGEVARGKDSIEALMILNHKDAIEFMVEMAEEIDINRYTILNIHGLLSNNLLLDPNACGRLRISPVAIAKSVYHPVEVPQLIEEYFQLIIQKASAIKNPFEQSIFLMIHLPYLQPFQDVNKRVSRLVGNIPFIRKNLIPLTFVDVPESEYIQGLLAIYELNRIDLFRDVFVWAYERSASLYASTLEVLGQPDPFRVQYRDLIRKAVYQIVHEKIDKAKRLDFISKLAIENIPAEDINHFIEVIEIEINSLHEGNFARYRIRPSEFFEWIKPSEARP